jgi:ABC-2 type transport system permease protein
VIAASLYILVCSARNRLQVRLRRLREPRYLVGAIVGAAYVYFAFFARLRSQRSASARRRSAPIPLQPTGLLASVGPALTGLGLLLGAAAAWLVPFNSGLLEFSDAETQFLFPAPVSRRGLILHRLMRSQLGMLFTSGVVALASPSLGGYLRLRVALGVWLLLCTVRVYFTGVTLARARLLTADTRARRVAWLPLAVIAGALLIVGAVLFNEFAGAPVHDSRDFLQRFAAVTSRGATWIILAPFTAVARPLYASWPQPYLTSMMASAAVLAACVAWVMLSDSAFQAATEAAADRRAQRREAASASKYRTTARAWSLASAGRAEIAFVWKSATQTLRSVDMRLVIRLCAMLAGLTVAGSILGRNNSLVAVAGGLAVGAALLWLMLAPQAIRLDLRDDLEHLDLLKTWPVRPEAVIRGELLWPVALVTVVAWGLLAIGIVLSGASFPQVHLSTRLGVGGAALILVPGLALAQLTIHNAAALFFPAWVPLGTQRSRGLDAMGQRLITLGGTWLALIVMALPAAVTAALVWFVLRYLIGAAAYVPAAAVAVVILVGEALVAIELLGPVYERLDALAVERAE